MSCDAPATPEKDGARTEAVRVAREVRKEVRAKDPALDSRPRTSRDDPEFMSVSAWTTFLTDPELDSNFFKASRLHFIGSWKARYQQILDGMPPPPPMPPPLQPSGERVILHIDMDCFFCSVAVRGRPEFDGMPVAVSWGNVDSDKATHGEISSANYEARKYGIRAGMFIGKAKELCPDLITLPYEFDKYSAAAEAMYLEVFALTPFVQGVSVDEAYADVTGLVASMDASQPVLARTRSVAESLRHAVRQATGCCCSVGASSNRLLARMATAKAKPPGSGFFHISAGEEALAYLAPLPVKLLPGVGYNTVDKLARLGIERVEELRAKTRRQLQEEMGYKTGEMLFTYARGIDARKWEARPVRKSVGAQVTWGVRFDNEAQVMRFVEQLAEEVAARLVASNVKARAVQVLLLRAVRNAPDSARKGHLGHGICDHMSRSVTLSCFTDEARVLVREASKLVADLKVPPRQVRGLGIQAQKLDSDPASTAASCSRRGSMPAPPPRVFDASKAPSWLRAFAKTALSPHASPNAKIPTIAATSAAIAGGAAKHLRLGGEEEAAGAREGEGSTRRVGSERGRKRDGREGLLEGGAGEEAQGGDRQADGAKDPHAQDLHKRQRVSLATSTQPADVAEMYASYYRLEDISADVAEMYASYYRLEDVMGKELEERQVPMLQQLLRKQGACQAQHAACASPSLSLAHPCSSSAARPGVRGRGMVATARQGKGGQMETQTRGEVEAEGECVNASHKGIPELSPAAAAAAAAAAACLQAAFERVEAVARAPRGELAEDKSKAMAEMQRCGHVLEQALASALKESDYDCARALVDCAFVLLLRLGATDTDAVAVATGALTGAGIEGESDAVAGAVADGGMQDTALRSWMMSTWKAVVEHVFAQFSVPRAIWRASE